MKRMVFTLALALATLGSAPAARAAELTFEANYLAPGWLPVSTFSLTPVWHAFGFQEEGTSYFSIGAPANGNTFLARFDPTSPLYETFFGGYVIDDFPFASDWENPDGSQKTDMTVADVSRSANELVALGVADQFAWLSAFPPSPTASSLVPGSLIVVPAEPLFPSFQGWFLLSFEVSTTSDLGADPANVTPSLSPVYPAFSQFSSLVPPFQPIIAEALVLVRYDVAHQNFIAIYGSGTNWKTLDGRDHNTPIGTILQIDQMMQAVTFQ